MVAEAVLHDVRRPDPGGMQEAAHAPPIMRQAAGLVDRAGRLKDLGEVGDADAAEGALRGLPFGQLGLTQNGELGEIGEAPHLLWGKAIAVLRGHLRELRLERVELRGLAGVPRAGLQFVVMVHSNPQCRRAPSKEGAWKQGTPIASIPAMAPASSSPIPGPGSRSATPRMRPGWRAMASR